MRILCSSSGCLRSENSTSMFLNSALAFWVLSGACVEMSLTSAMADSYSLKYPGLDCGAHPCNNPAKITDTASTALRLGSSNRVRFGNLDDMDSVN